MNRLFGWVLGLALCLSQGCTAIFYDYGHRTLRLQWNDRSGTLLVDGVRVDRAPLTKDYGGSGQTTIEIVPHAAEGFHFVSWDFPSHSLTAPAVS